MKVVVPIRLSEQVKPFLDCGADEFYCGVIFDEWIEKYGTFIEYNRRGNFHLQANFSSMCELYKAVGIIRNAEKKIYLTMNAIRICEEQLSTLEKLLKSARECGISGVIISDPILIPLCHALKIDFIMSSCANVINTECVRLYQEFGAKKIIYPRNIHFDDMKLISTQITEIEFEAFLMNSACKFTDGNCLGTHNMECGSLCSYIDKYPKIFKSFSNERIQSYTMQKILNNAFYYKQLFSKERGMGCAQCEIYQLLGLVDSVKIVGRLLSTDELCEQVILTKKNIEIATGCSSEQEYHQKMIYPNYLFSSGICKTGLSCYYH